MTRSSFRSCAALMGLPALLAFAVPNHITPTVTLKKQADVIKSTLPDASAFFLRTVTIGRAELNRIRQTGDFTPDDPDVRFYYGKTSGGDMSGVVLFPQVNTMHGPIEIGLTLDAGGAITAVTATKATVETKPWVERAVASGFLNRMRGLHAGDDPATALQGLSADDIGSMPYYCAKTMAAAVERGLVLYNVLYNSAPGTNTP